MDVDSDRGEVVLDDLGCPWTAGFEDAEELGVVVAAAGEASCAGDVGDERVDVAVAIPRLAGRDVHLGGRRDGGEAAAVRCECASVDGVAGRAAHARAREQRTAGVQVEVVDSERAVDEVALPPARGRGGVRAVEALEPGALPGGDVRSRSRASTPRSARPCVGRRRRPRSAAAGAGGPRGSWGFGAGRSLVRA
jgi:hypothetical protein